MYTSLANSLGHQQPSSGGRRFLPPWRGFRSLHYLVALFFSLFFLGAGVSVAKAEAEVPSLKSLVTDTAGVLSKAASQRLSAALLKYERTTGHQLAFVSVPTLDGENIEGFALRVAEEWKLGDKKRDDGLILLVAKQDRKMRIEVGYGLEGAIPDALAAQIIRNQLTPAFKKGDFDGGVLQAFSLLMRAAEGESVRVGPPPAQGKKKKASGLFRLIPFILLMLLLGGGRRGGMGGMGGIAALGMMGALGGGRRGGYGGGGFGGGGFGGGGGGGFGGGGASGGW